MGYATLTDARTYGFVASVYGLNITDPEIQANLDAASAWCDTKMSARYSMPILLPYDPSLVQAVVHIARYNILARRGFDENNASDRNVVLSYKAATDLLNEVQRQTSHFNVVESPAPTLRGAPQYAAPLIVSAPPQGWIPGPMGSTSNPNPSGVQ